MKGELTAEQLEQFAKDVGKAFHENYAKALKSGAIDESDIAHQPYILARAVLMITAESYWRTDRKDWNEMLDNLRSFV